ncbi:MAG: hypothetical protein WCG20_02560 [bacterium]
MKNDVGPFFFDLFSGKATPQKKDGPLVVDGKNDSIFLKRLNDEVFKTSKNKEDFLTKIETLLKEEGSSIAKWVDRRIDALGNNFEFILWSAWETITKK